MNPQLTLDNTALNQLHCEKNFERIVLQGLDTMENNNSIRFGSAFHKAVEYIDKKMPITDIIGKLLDEFQRIDSKLLIQTVSAFKFGQKIPEPIMLMENKPAVEYKFKFFYETIRGIDVYLAGTIDRMYICPTSGYLVILDYKTAGDKSTYGIQDKKKKYELSTQLAFYVWCLMQDKEFPEKYREMLLKSNYRTEILFAFYACDPPKFSTLHKNSFTEEFLSTFIRTTKNKINKAVDIMLKTETDYDGMFAYNMCFSCPFMLGCKDAGSEQERIFLERFNKRVYDPMTFR